MKVSTLIVDDEQMARRELSFLLEQDQRFKVEGEAANGREAIKTLKERNYSLVFLDIKMPGFSGVEVARLLQDFAKPPRIVFTTAYDEYAVEAFRLAAIDYLLKPIDEARFKETLDRVWKSLNTQGAYLENQNISNEQNVSDDLSQKIDAVIELFTSHEINPCKVPVEDNGRYRLIDHSSIYFFSTYNKKVMVYTQKSSYLTNHKLKELEEKLPGNFFRIHRSYIVNLNKIKEVIPWFKGKYQIVMADNMEHEIPVSRNKVDKLNQLLNLK